jgi:acyl-CoA synthetase (AMP-forming)/AMP-acid ligase II
MLSRQLVFTDAVAAHAHHFPGKPALIDGACTVTYGDIGAASHRIGRALGVLGVRPGEMVVLALEPSAAQAACLIGVMGAGAVACPLNIRLAPREVDAFLEPLGVRIAIASEALAAQLAGAGLEVITVQPGADLNAIVSALESAPALGPASAGRASVEGDPALVVGTGGTTGVPKAATYSQRGLWIWAAICGHIQEMRQDDVELYLSPFFHSTIVTNLLSMLFIGATVRVLPGYEEEAIVDAINDGAITRMYAAPTVLMRVLEAPTLRPGPQTRLRVIAFGSMKSQADMPALLRSVFPGIRLLTGYGTTEFGPVTRLKGDEIGGDPSCVGRPIAGARVEIRSSAGEPVPAGEAGEIVVWCPWQMTGYWGRPDLSQEVMFEGGIRPGDIGQFGADGRLYLIGRSKDAIKTGGENVWPAEVENALVQHPRVRDAVVYGVTDRVWGERVEAAVVVGPGPELTLAELRAFGREIVASYKLPRSLRVLEQIPLTDLSKPDRAALKRAAERTPLPDMTRET